MAIVLKINGTDRSEYVGAGSARWRRSLNQRSALDLRLEPRESGFNPTEGHPITIEEDGSCVWGGFVHEARRRVVPGSNAIVMDLRCLDYSYICDHRFCKDNLAASSPPGDISVMIKEIVTRFLDGEGITTTNVTSGFVWAIDLPFKNKSVSEAFNRISTITGWQWFIDCDKDLNFGPYTTSPASAAPFGLTATSANWLNMDATKSLSKYRNVQIVQTESPLEAAITEQWTMNGTSPWYPTSGPMTAVPLVYVDNGGGWVAKTVGTLTNNIPPYPGTHDFYIYDPAIATGPTYGIYVDSPASWSSSDTLIIVYGSQIVNQVTRTDTAAIAARAAIEGGSGRWEAVEDQKDLTTVAALQAYGDGLLRQYATVPTVVKFETRESGLEPGQLISIVYSLLGLNDSFLIESVDYTWIPARSDFIYSRVQCTDQEVVARPVGFIERVVAMARISKPANEAATTDGGDTSVGRFKVTFLFYDDAVAVDDQNDIPYRVADIESNEYISEESWTIEAATAPVGDDLVVTFGKSAVCNSPLSFADEATITLPDGDNCATGTTFVSGELNYQDFLRAVVSNIGSTTAGGYVRVVVEGKVYRST